MLCLGGLVVLIVAGVVIFSVVLVPRLSQVGLVDERLADKLSLSLDSRTSAQLSRRVAAELLNEQLKPRTMDLALAYTQELGWERERWHNNGAKLLQAGLITRVKTQRFGGRTTYVHRLLDQSDVVDASAEHPGWVEIRTHLTKVEEVTGIRQEDKQATVEATILEEPTQTYTKLASSGAEEFRGPTARSYSQEFRFEKYDDGWRYAGAATGQKPK